MPKTPKPLKLRCFIGVKFSLQGEIRPLTEALSQIDDEAARIRIVHAKNLHITLKFLGSVLASQLDEIEARLKQLASRHEPLALHCRGIGLFKNSLWLGISPNDRLCTIAADLNQAFSTQVPGSNDRTANTKPYVPHVTVARFSREAKPQLLIVKRQYEDTHWGDFQVKQFHMYRSQTVEGGARYSIIDSYSLVDPD